MPCEFLVGARSGWRQRWKNDRCACGAYGRWGDWSECGLGKSCGGGGGASVPAGPKLTDSDQKQPNEQCATAIIKFRIPHLGAPSCRTACPSGVGVSSALSRTEISGWCRVLSYRPLLHELRESDAHGRKLPHLQPFCGMRLALLASAPGCAAWGS